MAEDAPSPKKKRRPRSELKELMIEGGVEVLSQHGVEMQISSVSYAKVFEHLERTKDIRVTYGSVHERIWNSLQDYQLAVIERAGLWDNSGSAETLDDEVAALFTEENLATVDARDRTIKEAWRIAGKRSHESTEELDGWSSWLKTVVSMSTQPDGTVVREAASNGAKAVYGNLTNVNSAAIGGAYAASGQQPKEFIPEDVDARDILVRLAIAVSEGLGLRAMLTGEPDPTYMLATGPDGALEEWDLYGLVMWAANRGLFTTTGPED